MSVSIEQKLLSVGLAIAVVATTGSLYFSLGMGLIPCRLCWYQRILMYPLVVVFGVALATNDRTVYQTALPLAGVGVVVSGYHSAIQIIGGGVCGSFSCTTIQFQLLGVLSIPNMAFIAFIGIFGVCVWLREAKSSTRTEN